jgi:PEP-CTERM motif
VQEWFQQATCFSWSLVFGSVILTDGYAGVMAMKTKSMMALLAAFGMVAASEMPASAAVVLSSTPGAAVYGGPTPTFDFETPTPFSGGLVTNTSLAGVRARPFGSTGNYATVGPTDGSPGILNLAAFGTIDSITFLWGSVDTYNRLDVVDMMGGTLASFGGASVVALANGNQTSPFTNPLVTLTFTGADRTNVGGLRFISTQNAFEFDNITVNTSAVPEPETWAMMILGFALIGGLARRRRLAPIAMA